MISIATVPGKGLPAIEVRLRAFSPTWGNTPTFSFDRVAFEARFAVVFGGRKGGPKRQHDYDALVAKAEAFFAANGGWPASMEGRNGVYEQLSKHLPHCPKRTLFLKIFRPVHRRIRDKN
jgi:hypothetical protein